MDFKSTPARGDKLLQQLEQLVLENLENQQFGVQLLSEMIGISRSNLHRKIKKRTNKSISQFIRDIRLGEAYKLLQQEDVTAAEIAYQVGFNSNTYFNKCFVDRYGFTPGEAKKKINEEGSPGILATPENSGDHPGTHSKSKLAFWLVAGALAISVIVILTVNFTGDMGEFSSGKEVMAVMPLQYDRDIEDQEYLANGIQEALISELSHLDHLQVISSASMQRITGSMPEQIPGILGADYILEGTLYIASDSIRVNIGFINSNQSDQPVWTKSYQARMDNIFDLYYEITRDVVQNVEIVLSPDDQSRLSGRYPVNPDMYSTYLRGAYFLNQSTPEDFKKGMDYLKEAIRMDPANPLAYAKLAVGYTTLGHGPDPAVSYWQIGKAAAERAISLDSTLAEAHAALAIIKSYYERDWVGADREFQKALSLNPNLAEAHFHYAWFLINQNEVEKAFFHHRKSKELDPLMEMYTADLGSLHLWVGEYDDAIREAQLAIEMNDRFAHAYFVLGNAYVQKGEFDKAIEAHQRAAEINKAWSWLLANTYILAGEKDKGMKIVREIESQEISTRNAFGLGWIYMSLGDLDKSFYWLNKEPYDPWVPWIKTWPEFEPIRHDPRCETLLRKLNCSLTMAHNVSYSSGK